MNALTYGYLPVEIWPQFKVINSIPQLLRMSVYRNLNLSKWDFLKCAFLMTSYCLLSGLCFSLRLWQSSGKDLTWARQIILFNSALAIFLARVNVTCKEKVCWDMTLCRLVSFTLLLKHWPLPSRYIIGAFVLWRQWRPIPHSQHVICFSCSVSHVALCPGCDKLPLCDLVVLGQSERNWCCTKMYVNTYIIYIGISECYCCLSTNQGPGRGLGAFRGSLYHVLWFFFFLFFFLLLMNN